MPLRLINRSGNRWSRRTRWTPLLKNQREFQRTLTKERSRVDRSGSQFGFIILRLGDMDAARMQTVALSKLLHKRLRDTDEKGHLGPGRLGVVLPDTGSEDTEFVLLDVLKIAGANNLKIDGEAFVYPDENRKSSLPGRQLGESSEAEEAEATESETAQSSSLAMMLPAYPRWKRALDVTGAAIGLTLASPALLFFSAVIKATSQGPVLFTQDRTGYLGQDFKIYKLRTMVVDAEELKGALAKDNERDGPAFKMRKDPRVTSVGRFLRATGLDELPQLLNVLRGDMSLVGPRPLPVDEAAQCAGWQKRRQEVKPGLTCFWQLMKSRQISFSDWMRLDLSYARRTSFGLDVKLIVKTFAAVFLGRVGH